jgi:mono/diheme cytochrome c family protein
MFSPVAASASEPNHVHRLPRARRHICIFAAVLGVAGCDNMKRQPSRDEGDFPRRTPLHTVARGEPSLGDPSATGFRNGEPLARSPLPFSRELLARGRERFNVYCAVCHGEDGYGTGIVVRRGFPPPPSFHDERLRRAPDGHFFDVITRGFGVMLPYGDRVAPHDRWAIVGYIRALQRSQRATLADVPAEKRAVLLQP